MIRRRRRTSRWSQEIVGAALFAVTIGGIVYWMHSEPALHIECGSGDAVWAGQEAYYNSTEFGIKHNYYPGADCLTKGGLPCEADPPSPEIPPYSYYEKPPGAEFYQVPRNSTTGRVHPWVIGQMFKSWGVGPIIGNGKGNGGSSSGSCNSVAQVSEPGPFALVSLGVLLIGGLRKWK